MEYPGHDEMMRRARAELAERLDLASLAGLHEDEAKRRVEDAGYVMRLIRPGWGLRSDLRIDRVTVYVDEAGTVTDAEGPG